MSAEREGRWWQGALGLALVLGAAAWGARSVVEATPLLVALFLAPWVASLVLWGLPHGAVDHLVLARVFRPRASWTAIGLAALAYAALALLVGLLWWRWPPFAFAGFIALTWFHWGTGDLWWSWTRDPAALPTRLARCGFLLWRGALPMLIPLVVDPGTYRQTAVAATELTGWQGDWAVLESEGVRGAALAVCVVLALLRWSTAGRGRGATLDRNEDAALLLFFLVVPALPAVGLYFTFWHGWRHVLRLQHRTPGPVRPDAPPASSFFRQAWPTTALSLGVLLTLALALPGRADPWALLGVYLMLIACLTVPHALLVGWMDWTCGLWTENRK